MFLDYREKNGRARTRTFLASSVTYLPRVEKVSGNTLDNALTEVS